MLPGARAGGAQMKFQVEEISTTQRKLEIEIPAERVATEFERAFRSVSRRANIRGFRPSLR